VSKADRAGVNALLDKFIPQVLAGKDLKAGKALVGGYVGVDTIQRYPAAGTRFHGWLLNYATPGDVGFDITVQPVNKRKIGAWSFRGEAQRLHGVWKITDWNPVAQFQPLGKAALVNGPNDLSPGAAGGLGPISRSTTYLLGLGSLVATRFDVAHHPIPLLGGDQRAELRVGVQSCPAPGGLGLLGVGSAAVAARHVSFPRGP
jgi:hypothetical protein